MFLTDLLAEFVAVNIRKHDVQDHQVRLLRFQSRAKCRSIREAARLKQELEAALADWQPREANVLSDHLEDVLDHLERAFVA